MIYIDDKLISDLHILPYISRSDPRPMNTMSNTSRHFYSLPLPSFFCLLIKSHQVHCFA